MKFRIFQHRFDQINLMRTIRQIFRTVCIISILQNKRKKLTDTADYNQFQRILSGCVRIVSMGQTAYAIIATGEGAIYANVMLQKSVVV